jgi:hypothetical protein
MSGLFNSPLTSASPLTSTATSASAQSTPNLGQAAKTSSSGFHSTTTTAAATSSPAPAVNTNPVYIPPQESPTTTSVNPTAPSSQANASDPTPTMTSAQIVAVIGTGTIGAIPDSSGIILPDGSTATIGSVATLTDSNNAPVVVSVVASGIYLEGTDSSNIYLANPTPDASSSDFNQPVPPITTDNSVISAAPGVSSVLLGGQTTLSNGPSAVATPIATIGNQIISAVPGASTLVVEGQTISLSGSAVTLTDSNVVASLAPSGLVVQYSGGLVSSFALPTSIPVTDTVPIATIENQIISATPGASTLIIGGQTLSISGPAATLSESNAVASLALSGLVLEYSGGGVSVFVLPTPSPQMSAGDTLDGYTVSTLSGGSALVIGSQTLSIGGPIVTVGNDEVMSLGASGIIIQEPGGKVTTFAIQSSTLAQSTATLASGNSSASAIASSELASIPK